MSKYWHLLGDPDNPRSLSSRARSRRWDEMLARFPALADMRVLDLGGTPRYWREAPVRPKDLTVVNLDSHIFGEPCDESWMDVQTADACTLCLPERFDLVVSNSLLEHVGGHERRQRLADVVHHHADRHWVQTPYRYFPIEPHWVAPGMQWLPVSARASFSRHWPLAEDRSADAVTAVRDVLDVELVSVTEMRHYFPDSVIWRERFAGIPKSLVAVR